MRWCLNPDILVGETPVRSSLHLSLNMISQQQTYPNPDLGLLPVNLSIIGHDPTAALRSDSCVPVVPALKHIQMNKLDNGCSSEDRMW